MNAMRIPVEPKLNQCFPVAPIIVIKEYGLTVISAQDDVVKTAWYVQSRFSGHGLASEK